MFERAILHLDFDAFFASVECLRNSALKGKPLIIGGTGARGVVSSCNHEAQTFGVHTAMPVRTALLLCPDAIVLQGDMEAYEKHSQLLTEIMEEEAPLFEKASIDEFYVDLTGMDRHFGCWKWSQQLRQKILRESGLPLSIGLSVNKLVSKVSTGEARPNGCRLVEAGTEKEFLAPLPVRKIPSIDPLLCKRLRFMGVRTIHTLSRIPPRLLEFHFGPDGSDLWKKANALDDSPVVPYRRERSLSAEHVFQVDTTDVSLLKKQLAGLVAQLAYELRQAKKLTTGIAVKIRHSDSNTYSKQKRIAPTTNDRTITGHAHHLFDQLFQRRVLVRLISLRFTGLVAGHPQLSLFENDNKESHLLEALDGIRKRWGQGAVSSRQ